MDKFRIAVVITLFLLSGNFNELYSQEAVFNKATNSLFEFPSEKKAETSFYLLGNIGESENSHQGLIAFKTYLDSVASDAANSLVLFLGNNFAAHTNKKKEAQPSLDAAINTVKDYNGEVIFLPGNRDWENGGVKALREQEKYLGEQLKIKNALKPRPGCPLQFVDISRDTHLIIMDSEWFITDWDDHPLINDDCPEIRTREAMLTELETELKKNQNKTTIIAMHHPIYSNGKHGGVFGFEKNPKIPILQPFINLFRTSGALSHQDIQNGRYKDFTNRIKVIADKWGKTLFVSAHENSLQYIEETPIKQIISGSAAKASYAKLGENGLFAYPGAGFAVVTVFRDGSSWVRFFKGKDGKPTLLYAKELFPADTSFTDSKFADYDAFTKASIYGEEENQRTGFYKSLWGERYRKLYDLKIRVPVAKLDTLYGGLKPVREGGGHQTTSIRVKDSLDREYNFRMLRKNGIQLIQSVGYKDRLVEDDFKETFPEKMIQDFYTGSHPYAFMAIPKLADAGDVSHTNPQLFYLPKQQPLGKYNSTQGGELYMLEERPEENWLGKESFAEPNHDIQSTEGMFDRLRRDEKYSVDENAFIRARLFDMLIGDWDRHNDQWRWAEIEDADGNRKFHPIPRDRDQVFSNFDGLLFNNLRSIIGFVNQFGNYGEDIKSLRWFNRSAVNLDRSLLQSATKEDWLAQAQYLQHHITDQVVEKAFADLPAELHEDTTTRELIENLKGRRDNLAKIAERYYKFLAEYSIITGTDKDDFIDVERLEDGKTKVTISRNKDGNRDKVVQHRVFSHKETKEIWVYGLDDDDQFNVSGQGSNKIKVRLIGGQNNDTYNFENGKRSIAYDHESRNNPVLKKNGARTIFTDNYAINTFNYNKKITSSNNLLPSMQYNPDNGFILGIANTYVGDRFVTNPFSSKHTFMANYFFGTQGFEIGYTGIFADAVGAYNFRIGGYFSSPKHTRNFFGYGNETGNNEDELSRDYNRVRIKTIKAQMGLEKESPYGNKVNLLASFETNKVAVTAERFITEIFTNEQDFFKTKYFAGLEANYQYQSFDDILNPTRGLMADLSVGGKMNTAETSRTYGYIIPQFEMYNSLSKNRKWVLNTRARGHINIGNGYEFYQAATVGDKTGLRGYRQERFSGKQALAAGTDLRYSFNKFKTAFLPFQIGVFGGMDVGRVWIPTAESKVWHQSYGGGIWISGAQAFTGKINIFNGDEGVRLSARVVFGI